MAYCDFQPLSANQTPAYPQDDCTQGDPLSSGDWVEARQAASDIQASAQTQVAAQDVPANAEEPCDFASAVAPYLAWHVQNRQHPADPVSMPLLPVSQLLACGDSFRDGATP